MKKLLFASFCLSTLFFSCKKTNKETNNEDTGYYLKTSIDGQATNFDVTPTATITKSNMVQGQTTIAIWGIIGDPSKGVGLTLSISNAPGGKPIVAGTYTDQDHSEFYTSSVYQPFGSGAILYQAVGEFQTEHPLTVVITAIDDNSISGTFSGDVFYYNGETSESGTSKKSLTNGKFNLNFQKD